MLVVVCVVPSPELKSRGFSGEAKVNSFSSYDATSADSYHCSSALLTNGTALKASVDRYFPMAILRWLIAQF